ncbi:hypothetical protein IJJ08_00305, partial [bacterium]|nr:hypothetical protein [bacterium]
MSTAKQKKVCLTTAVCLVSAAITALTVQAAVVGNKTMKLEDMELGSVINTEGASFVKLASNSYMQSSAATCPQGSKFVDKYVDCCDEIYKGICVHYWGCTNPTGLMQEFHGCSDLETPTDKLSYTDAGCLVDSRDGKTYEIRKLIDGQCWMTTNLKYSPARDASGHDSCLKTTYYGTRADTSSAPGSTASPAYGNGNMVGDCRYPYSSTSTDDSSNMYGYLYDWAAALQDPLGYYNNSYNPDGFDSTNLTYTKDIQGMCPDGWRLPHGGNYNSTTGNGGDFARLNYLVFGSTANGTYAQTFWQRGKAFNGAYGDACSEAGVLWNQGSHGVYWSSTGQSAANAYNLTFNTSGGVNPVRTYYKYYGRTV